MAQHQYVEKPRKVLADQYLEASNPEPVGIHRCGLAPDIPTGLPHVHVGSTVVMLQEGDWILASKWAPDVPTGVMSNEEFQDTFGAGPPEGEIVT